MRPAHVRTRVRAHERVAPDHFELVLESHPALEAARPGQFINVRVSPPGSCDPLLRRPFSIYRRLPGNRVSILYRVVGRGTALLGSLVPGDVVDVLGPLGQGFRVDPGKGRILLVGGGVGVPPLCFLAQTAPAPLRARMRAVLGFENASRIIAADAFRELGVPVTLTTLDGSAGHRGLVTDALEPLLQADGPTAVYACGPAPMLATVAAQTVPRDIPAQVALEEWMGCGIGVCLSCVVGVQTPDGPVYQRVCREGPVFDAAEVRFP